MPPETDPKHQREEAVIQIKSRWDSGKVLYTAENAADIRGAVAEAVRADANLRGANLRDADLGGADLGDAVLGDADLGGANLGGANLGGANLGDAYLGGANLRDANLRGANLRDADLGDADLGGANLGDDAHWRSPLWATRQDMFSILDQAPAEVAALREAMVDGKINGSTYSDGECGCLCGTIGIVHAGSGGSAVVKGAIRELGIQADGSRPAERWFIAIELGDKPLDIDDETIDWSEQSEGVFRISRALKWLDEWELSRRNIAEALS